MGMIWRFAVVSILFIVAAFAVGVDSAKAQSADKHLITVYDRGIKTVFLTEENTIGEALKAADIILDDRDTVEPAIDEDLVAPDYRVNIYRARPVIVVDGAIRMKTVSPFQTVQQIARDVGVVMYDEDTATLELSTDFLGDGAGLKLTIIRSVPIVLDLYGKKTEVRTQARTVGEMLKEKNIILGDRGRVSSIKETAITAGMEIRVWREGEQTISVEESIPVNNQLVYDLDRPLGYRAVQQEGKPGVRSITYQVEIKDGAEISRTEIANIVTRQPSDQVEVIGLKNNGTGLTAAKGAQQFTDSKGVTHRETYYDLNMNIVMRSCGQGGRYSVRPDGAKVDTQGYVIIAANYGNYPKCSVVETSLGPGKVYDTGGFAERHPHGFDLATDWSRADGI